MIIAFAPFDAHETLADVQYLQACSYVMFLKLGHNLQEGVVSTNGEVFDKTTKGFCAPKLPVTHTWEFTYFRKMLYV